MFLNTAYLSLGSWKLPAPVLLLLAMDANTCDGCIEDTLENDPCDCGGGLCAIAPLPNGLSGAMYNKLLDHSSSCYPLKMYTYWQQPMMHHYQWVVAVMLVVAYRCSWVLMQVVTLN